MTPLFKGIGHKKVAIAAPSPSPLVGSAPDLSLGVKAAFKSINGYIAEVCPGALSGAIPFSEMGRRGYAGDLVDHLSDLEITIDRLVLTKADLETILAELSKWEMTVKGIIRAIAIAKTQNGELV